MAPPSVVRPAGFGHLQGGYATSGKHVIGVSNLGHGTTGTKSSPRRRSGSSSTYYYLKKKATMMKKKKNGKEENRSEPLRTMDHLDGGDFYDRKYARIALKHFNMEMEQQGGPEYKLVKGLKMVTMFEGHMWHHLNFRAKPKNAPDSEAVLFFGEVQCRASGYVTMCRVLYSGDPQGSCVGCDLIHPPDGFRSEFCFGLSAAHLQGLPGV